MYEQNKRERLGNALRILREARWSYAQIRCDLGFNYSERMKAVTGSDIDAEAALLSFVRFASERQPEYLDWLEKAYQGRAR